MEGKGNYTSFPVFCSDLQPGNESAGWDCTMQEYCNSQLLWAEFTASVPFLSTARFPLGFPTCLLCLHCSMCSGIVFLQPSVFMPPSFLLTWQGRLLFLGKASPSSSPFFSEPSVTSLGLLFLLLLLLSNIFLSPYRCLPFSSPSAPKLFLLQSCPI